MELPIRESRHAAECRIGAVVVSEKTCGSVRVLGEEGRRALVLRRRLDLSDHFPDVRSNFLSPKILLESDSLLGVEARAERISL